MHFCSSVLFLQVGWGVSFFLSLFPYTLISLSFLILVALCMVAIVN